jgi:hypothetical protein
MVWKTNLNTKLLPRERPNVSNDRLKYEDHEEDMCCFEFKAMHEGQHKTKQKAQLIWQYQIDA